METETIERDPSVELVELIRFLADREGVPADPRRSQFRHNEMATTIRLLLRPTGWLSNPFTWEIHGPAELSIEYPTLRPGWRLADHLPSAQNRRADMLTLEFAVPGERSPRLPIDNARREWPALAC